MRSVSVLLILVVAAMANVVPASKKPHYDVSNAKALFEAFMKKYDRNYKDDADKDAHYRAFVETLKLINDENADNDSNDDAILDINQFADLTQDDKLSIIERIGKGLLSLKVLTQLEK